MNIQLYQYKKHFDVQKALRFFKERRIKVQVVDLKKTKPGLRELQLFASVAGGAKGLVDVSNAKVKEHPISYTQDAERILAYLVERPEFLVTPLIRDGRKAWVGFQENELQEWISK